MECSQCGYLFQPFEQDCPRCLRQQHRAAVPVSGSAATPIPAAPPPAAPIPAAPPPAAPLPAAPAPAMPSASKNSGRVKGIVSGLIAVSSIACIYLAGLSLGNFFALQKAAPAGQFVAGRPAMPPQHFVSQSAPFYDPVAELRKQEIAAFITGVQNLETRRHLLLQARSAQPDARTGKFSVLITDGPTPSQPDQGQAPARASLEQIHQESAGMKQLHADLQGLHPPTSCADLRNAYDAYWRDITDCYDKLLYALDIEQSDPSASKSVMDFLYSTGVANLRAEAGRADQELARICAFQHVPKTFTID